MVMVAYIQLVHLKKLKKKYWIRIEGKVNNLINNTFNVLKIK